MKILFLDQSGSLGGAELCLLDIAQPYRDHCVVGLFADGPFKQRLEQQKIPVEVLTTQAIPIRKGSSLLKSLTSAGQIPSLACNVAAMARGYDLIYANTPKALVIGALASALTKRPLIYHLHDIISPQHFSQANCFALISLANQFASLVIANSQASQSAFITAGGKPHLCTVIYNGFDISQYPVNQSVGRRKREELGLKNCFLVGHFSRLSPWKGQHILIEALMLCPENITAVLVGDALFGEQVYVNQLRMQVQDLGLQNRVRFLGFHSDVSPLMTACDLVVHTSIAPEPFGRVIVESMLCGTPIVAAAAGGATELITHGETGWLCSPNNPRQLAETIMNCYELTEHTQQIARTAYAEARKRFDVAQVNQLIDCCLSSVLQ